MVDKNATKSRLAALMEEESKNSAQPIKATKEAKPMGRPKSRPETRQASFHLPVALLDRVDLAASKHFARNKSALAEQALCELLDKIGG